MLLPYTLSSHSLLMRNFMGAVWQMPARNVPEPSACRTWSCRAALTSAWLTVCRSGCCTLPPPGATMSPWHLEWTLTLSWGQNQRHIAKTCKTHCRSDTPPRWGFFENLGTRRWRRGSLVLSGTPGTAAISTPHSQLSLLPLPSVLPSLGAHWHCCWDLG